MDRNNSYFIVSGFISIGLFAIFFATFLYMAFMQKTHLYALKKDNYITVSISTIPIKKQSHRQKQKTIKNIAIPQAKPKQDIDIDNLFSDVWTKKITKKKQKIKKQDNRLLRDLTKKTKIIEDETMQKSDIKGLDSALQKEQQNQSTSNEVNQYRAKIQAIIYEHFYPPANSQGYMVEAIIELDSFGKVLDFRIVRYSTNEALNQECDKIKKRLSTVIFPINPKGKTERFLITLKAKE